MSKTINAVFGGGLFATTAKVFQYDVGDKLRFLGIELPDSYSVDFANSRTGESTTVFGGADGVEIPPAYFIPGTEIYAWVVISDSDGHYTKYQVRIPIYERAARTGVEPTPAQADALDEAINALNSAVEDVEDIASGIPDQINAALEEAKASGEFDGPPGPQGEQGPQGESGTPGNSIWRGGAVRASGTTPYYFLSDLSGRTDVSPSAGDLIVSNIFWLWQIKRISGQTVYLTSLGSIKGETGADGEDGYSPTVTVTEITGGHRVTITDEDGDHVFDVMDGQGSSITVDSSLSSTSENPVQNKAIYSAFTAGGQQLNRLALTVEQLGTDLNNKADIDDLPDLTGYATEQWVTEQGYINRTDLDDYRTAAAQDAIDDAQDTAIAAKYTKPSSGIPKTDLAAAVQTSLVKADTAVQTETDPTVPSWAKQSSKPAYTASEVGAVASNQGAANASKVLTVNRSGLVVPEDNRFVVTLTPTAADYSGTMDKTPAELAAAYDAGKRIIAYAPSFSFLCEMSLATIRSNNLYTFDFIALGELGGQDIMLRLLTSDTASTYRVKTYPLSIPSAQGVSF